MAPVFVDTSALVKYYYPEKGSDQLEGILLNAARAYLSQVAIAEFASALMKKVRTRTLEIAMEVLIWDAFQDDLTSGQMELISFDARHYQRAAEIIIGYGQTERIRTLDSLQLAAALDVHNANFVCADKFLSDIAVKMGFNVQRV